MWVQTRIFFLGEVEPATGKKRTGPDRRRAAVGAGDQRLPEDYFLWQRAQLLALVKERPPSLWQVKQSLPSLWSAMVTLATRCI